MEKEMIFSEYQPRFLIQSYCMA